MTEPSGDPIAKEGLPSALGGVFVGRTSELGILRAGLDRAFCGRGGLFLISGEPGIGKTGLADALAVEAASRGARIAWGRCWEGGGAPIYWPWIQVARSLLAAQDREAIFSQSSAAADLIAPLIPELAASADERAGKRPAPPLQSGQSSESDRFPLFDAFASLLKNASATAPLLVVLDDCHAADEASLLLLRFVARELRETKIVIVVTYRDAEVRQNQRTAEIIGELIRDGQSISLRGIGEAAVSQLVVSVAARPPNPAMVSALYKATEGNPFFVSEILRLLVAEGRLEESLSGRWGSFKVPESVEGAIMRRLGSISLKARRILNLASVLGREFDLSLLSRVSETAVGELANAMEESGAYGIVSEVPDQLGRYRFCHFLFAETLSARYPKSACQQLHGRIVSELEKVSQIDPDAHLAELAFHSVQALPMGEATKAVGYASRAARRARSLLAYEEAVRLYEMALSALGPQSRDDHAQRCELLLGLGEAQAKAGGLLAIQALLRAGLSTGAESWGRGPDGARRGRLRHVPSESRNCRSSAGGNAANRRPAAWRARQPGKGDVTCPAGRRTLSSRGSVPKRRAQPRGGRYCAPDSRFDDAG